MGLMDKVKWGWDKVAVLTGLLEKWRPRKCKTEKDYENNLKMYLEENLDRTIEKQSGQGRFRADLVVDKDLYVELKLNLKTPAGLQRLKGQLDAYKKWEGTIILLLIGETPREIKDDLRTFLKEQGLSEKLKLGIDMMAHDKVIVIEKP